MYCYRDKHKETERKKEMIKNGGMSKKKQKFKSKTTISWSDKKEVKLKRKIRKEKKQIAEEKKKRKHVDDDDLNELQNDFKLLKKLKRKKVNKN